MNWLTVVLLLVLGLITWRAWRSGFVRELVSLSAVILAVPVAGVLYDDMYPKVEPIVDNEQGAALISFLAIMFGVIVAGQVAAHLLRGLVTMLNLGIVDQAAGAMFGLFKGVLICDAVLVALIAFPSPDLRDEIDGSAVASRLVDSAPLVLSVLPRTFDHALEVFQGSADTTPPPPGRTVAGTSTPAP